MYFSLFRARDSKVSYIADKSDNRNRCIFKDINKNIRTNKNVKTQNHGGRHRREGKWESGGILI